MENTLMALDSMKKMESIASYWEKQGFETTLKHEKKYEDGTCHNTTIIAKKTIEGVEVKKCYSSHNFIQNVVTWGVVMETPCNQEKKSITQAYQELGL